MNHDRVKYGDVKCDCGIMIEYGEVKCECECGHCGIIEKVETKNKHLPTPIPICVAVFHSACYTSPTYTS